MVECEITIKHLQILQAKFQSKKGAWIAPSTLSLFVFIIEILAQEYETLQIESWQKEWKRLKPKTTRSGKTDSKLLRKEELL